MILQSKEVFDRIKKSNQKVLLFLSKYSLVFSCEICHLEIFLAKITIWESLQRKLVLSRIWDIFY